MRATVIIPTLNEATGIAQCLRQVQGLQPRPEVLCVDGGSDDATATIVGETADVTLLHAPRGRAVQMNVGAQQASAEWLVFLHADTAIAQSAWDAFRDMMHASTADWGWFDVAFDDARRLYRAHAWLISQRARLTGRPTGDQAIFVRKQLFEMVGGFPGIAMMEDVALVRALRGHSRGVPLSPPVVTSARRWRRDGLLRTILRMWYLKLQYLAGRDPSALVDAYPHVR